MITSCGNIYKKARKDAGMTQEQAAELLNTSTRSLTDYERGITTPPDDIVCRMAEIYDAPWLGYAHLKYSTAVGQRWLPSLNISDLAKAVLRLQKEIKDVENINNQIIDLACDGIIDKTEEKEWNVVKKEIDEMIGAAMAVVFSTEKEKALI